MVDPLATQRLHYTAPEPLRLRRPGLSDTMQQPRPACQALSSVFKKQASIHPNSRSKAARASLRFSLSLFRCNKGLQTFSSFGRGLLRLELATLCGTPILWKKHEHHTPKAITCLIRCRPLGRLWPNFCPRMCWPPATAGVPRSYC